MSADTRKPATEAAVEAAGDYVRYIVVVHGMGEPRENSTLLPVINRFAHARSELDWRGTPVGSGTKASRLKRKVLAWLFPWTVKKPGPAGVTLGQLRGISGKRPWVEFEGIPKAGTYDRPFIGTPSDSGENLRFVDIFWGDISQEHFEKAGQSVGTWSSSLITRLRNSNRNPAWAVDLLQGIRRAVLPVQRLLSLRDPKLNDFIFNRFLGDVQMYGEDPCCRGRAIRRLHDRLARVQAEHDAAEDNRVNEAKKARKKVSKREARYTIIAHSLGTIMTLDALMFALADAKLREDGKIEGVSFDGYGDPVEDPDPRYRPPARQDKPDDRKTEPVEKDELPGTEWIARVDHLVTMGSPIDKFLVIWWYNYEHLKTTKWMDAKLLKKRAEFGRIEHYNYCDEQDPVGHELDIAYSYSAVRTVLGCEYTGQSGKTFCAPNEDEVFVRYVVPGLAHIEYWKDQQLFDRILALTVDNCAPSAVDGMWYRADVYKRVLAVSHRFIPAAFLLVGGYCFARVVLADGLVSRVVPIAVAAGVLWLGCRAIQLMTEWRQALAVKRGVKVPEPVDTAVSAALRSAKTAKSRKKLGEKMTRWIVAPFWGWSVVSLLAVVGISVLRAARESGLLPPFMVSHLSLITETAVVLYSVSICGMILYGWRAEWYRKSQEKWAKYK